MELSDKISAVQRMQEYIVAHIDDEIIADELWRIAGYSKHHAIRIFKGETQKTPFEYHRALRLTKAAQNLRDSDSKVIDIALNSGFDSYDGFTRAFARQFDITPLKYHQETPPVRYFTHNPIQAYYHLKEGFDPMPKEPIKRTMTVTAVERPARKLILLRSVNATDYLTFCEETGCDWRGLLDSIPEKQDFPALLTLPSTLMKPGTGNIASGICVPLEYDKPIPAGYESIKLPPCTMLYFQGAPFEDEADFGEAIGLLWELMDAYDLSAYGWEPAPELAPYFNFGAEPAGAKMAFPVRKI
jgi:AraC-like DNA-binding protein